MYDGLAITLRHRVNALLASAKWLSVRAILKENGWPAVLFGGTLRDVLIEHRAKPRDIDIVVDVSDVDALSHAFREYVVRRTRFGGLRLKIADIPLDVWPLSSTWGYQKVRQDVSFRTLPSTTFLNIEAIATELVPSPGKSRQIYESGFFDAIRTRQLDVNLVDNPFPLLAVCRAVFLARRLSFGVRRNLMEYLLQNSRGYGEQDYLDMQRKHYGTVVLPHSELLRSLDVVAKAVAQNRSTVRLAPLQPAQLEFWPASLSCSFSSLLSDESNDAHEFPIH